MSERTVIHIVDADTRVCAQIFRAAMGLGYHAEVYSSLAELCARRLTRGLVLVRDSDFEGGIDTILDVLEQNRVWLPVAAFDDDPSIPRVVSAIKRGALDYLRTPISECDLARLLEGIDDVIAERERARRALDEARERIGILSVREREVLDKLADGNSNKLIARELQISPRTVEIHRANMMSKLGASHSAEAIRMRLAAQLDRCA